MAAAPVEALSKKELQPEASADPQVVQVAQTFLSQYYQIFDTNRQGLVALYRPESRVTFEGETYSGPEKIVLKFLSLAFQQVVHEVSTFDCHLTIDGSVLIVVIGRLKADGDQVMSFSETFNLKQIGDSLFIMNQIFRLALHHS